jgi:alpha-beta hydrolase superfamily lysophospholipase
MSSIPFSWQSKSGFKIHAQEWKPVGKANAVIVLVHGLGEHCNRYEHVAEFYNSNNIAVLSFDHVGHGKSEGIRGHELSFDSTCDDIQHLLDDAKAKYPFKTCKTTSTVKICTRSIAQ